MTDAVKVQFTAFVPLKRHSRRLPNKNYLELAGRPLAYHVCNALLKVKSVDKVCVFSSSDDCMKHLPPGVEFIERDPKIDLDSVQALEFVRAFAETVPSQYYILAHATSPFITTESLQKGVDGILGGQYDSAVAVSEIRKYSWFDSRPLNYDINNIAQTQDIQPVVFETGGFYMFSRDDILLKSRRIGDRPYLVNTTDIEAMDIDYIHEFLMARRFQDLLKDKQEISRPSSGTVNGSQSDVPLTTSLVLFELEDILSGHQDEVLEHAQWLNILEEQGKTIAITTRMDREKATKTLKTLSVHLDLILTFNGEITDDMAAKLVREGCKRKGLSPHQSAYVGSSPLGSRVAELVGMRHYYAGWVGEADAGDQGKSFDSISGAVIRFLESGR